MQPLLVPGFLDAPTCRRLRAAMDAGRRDVAEIVGDAITHDADVRRASSIDIDTATLLALEARIEGARTVVEAWAERRLGPREGTGLLRYECGGFYRTHRDRGSVPGWPGAAHRAVAVIVFLNGGFEGGTLHLYPDRHAPIELVPVEGLLAAFSADVLHEVLPVASGIRDTAVDWFCD